MIQCQSEPLTPNQETELRAWLAKGAVATLVRVVEARVKVLEVQALTEMLEGSAENAKVEAGTQTLQSAQRYATFLAVLKEFTDRPIGTAFEIVKLT